MKFKTGRHKVEFRRDKKTNKVLYKPSGIGWKDIEEGDEIESILEVHEGSGYSLNIITTIYRKGKKLITTTNKQGNYANIVNNLKLTEIKYKDSMFLDFLRL